MPPGRAKGIHASCRRVVRSLAIAPALEMVHRVWPMISERSIGGNQAIPSACPVSGWLTNPVSVMPESAIRRTSAPERGPSGDWASPPGVTGAAGTGPGTWTGTTTRCEPGQ